MEQQWRYTGVCCTKRRNSAGRKCNWQTDWKARRCWSESEGEVVGNRTGACQVSVRLRGEISVKEKCLGRDLWSKAKELVFSLPDHALKPRSDLCSTGYACSRVLCFCLRSLRLPVQKEEFPNCICSTIFCWKIMRTSSALSWCRLAVTTPIHHQTETKIFNGLASAFR